MAAPAKLSRWTPKRAAKFCRDRIVRIENLLQEISYCWGDADNVVVDDCDRLIAELKNLKSSVDYAGENANV
jgi:hypothetical protein